MMICWSSTRIVVSRERLLVTMSAKPVLPMPTPPRASESATLPTSSLMAMRIDRSSWMCGVTVSSTPTFSRLMVWKGLLAPSVVVVNEPVRKGICCPETLVASSLSRVSTLGVESRLARVSDASAVTRAPKKKPSPFTRDRAIVGDAKPAAMASGSMPVVSASASPPTCCKTPPMMPLSVVLNAGAPLPPRSPPASSTPWVLTLVREISTTAASMSTCARRTSSWPTVASTSCMVPGSARTMRAFKDS